MALKDVPHDHRAEMAVVGSMVSFPDSIPVLTAMLGPEDFHHPTYGDAFALVAKAHVEGRKMDFALLLGELEAQGRPLRVEQMADIIEASTSAYVEHAGVIIAHRVRRDGLAVAADLSAALRTPVDPAEPIEEARTRLDTIETPLGRVPAECRSVDDFIAEDEDRADEWVVPGLMRRSWRCVIVSDEGGGKSTLFRQFAVTASQGIHPLTFRPMPHNCRVLLVDMENPTGSTRRWLRRMISNVEHYEPGRITLWSQSRGVNLTARSGRSTLEAVIAQSQPAVVLLGPVYKLIPPADDKKREAAIFNALMALDDLRARYGFALLLEAHAPMGWAGQRDFRPMHSILYSQWPELGYGMVREKKDRPFPKLLRRFRGDRDETAAWPEKLDKGNVWPWVGVWPEGERFDQESF